MHMRISHSRTGGRHSAPVFSILLLLSAQALWAQKDRLSDWIGPTDPVRLNGSLHPLAQPQFDRGPVDSGLKLNLITLGLKKTPQQQADLDNLLTQLQDRVSPAYHRWLTPEQYADHFGVSRNDMEKITVWLRGAGFQVQAVSRGRDYVVFSGTAGQVQSALHTEIHRYVIRGEEHFANASEPEVPSALAEMVTGFRGLNDFKPKPAPKRVARLATAPTATPQPKIVIDKSGINYLVPDDLAAIYNVSGVYAAGWDGAGQTIAIAGASDVNMGDIEAFRKTFNLPFNDPQVVLAPGSPDPGTNADAMGEADLDLEWAGAIARRAQIIYVNSVDSFYSAFSAIDNATAPVLSTSFGLCEYHFAPTDIQLFRSYSQKAAALGITWISSAGDSGAAGCEDQNGIWTYATTRMSVEMPASLPEVTAVGGSEFNEGNGSYWSSTPGPNSGTAVGYIPEMAWNDESFILANLGQDPILHTAGFGFASGGGGASIWFTKPQWQTGPGVPNDGARDVPDVALTASADHDPYLLATQGNWAGVGGTSASAPVFAGIVALLNQYLVGQNIQPQPGVGNINPMLYYLAQHYTGIFHDITTGGNQVPCVPGSTQDCGSSASFGFSAGPGYDQATGLGSVDADTMIGTWAKVAAPSPHIEVTAFTAAPLSVASGGTINLSITIANEGQANAGAFLVGQYLSTSGQIDASAVMIAQCSYTGLNAGATSKCSGPISIPSNVKPGQYYLIAVADSGQALSEPDRSGGTRLADTGEITIVAATAHLAVTSFTASTSVKAGSPFNFSFTVGNQGSADAGPFYMGIYYDPAGQNTPQWVSPGLCSVSALRVGVSYTCQGSAPFPSAAPAGEYTLVAEADTYQSVPQADRSQSARAAETGILSVTK